jgi:aspartyl-tRNA(Asn)/glutamyl-tRNA(Gln) amidotransferase subunit B
VRARLPELPDAKRQRYLGDFGLPVADAGNLAGDVELSAFFDMAMADAPALAKPIANLLLNDVAAYLNANNLTLVGSGFAPRGIVELAQLISEDAISSKQAKEVLSLMAESGEAPASIVEKHGLRQVSDSGALETAVEEALAAHPDKVAEYRDGKTGLLGFFVGQVMRATQGQGNPKLINEILLKHLDNKG